MAQALSNDLIQEAVKLAKILAEKFTPPEFIPGCEVISVADLNEYATNNGWVEAVCGQHNQQRVRWKSADTVANGNFIDVLYFQERGIFEAYGVGGSTPIAGTPNVTLDADAEAILSLTIQELGLDVQNANKVLAGPASGGDDEPTFRALVDADIPAAIARDSELVTLGNQIVDQLNAHISETVFLQHHASAVSVLDTAANFTATDVEGVLAELAASGGAAAASETVAGIAELATQAEANAGTDDARIVTPLKLANYAGLRLPNILINGGADVWQRTTNDTAVTTTRKYVCDRWAVKTAAGTLANVQRSTTVRTGALSKYSLELVGATGVTTVDVDQRIRAANSGAYKTTVAFSAWVYNGSGGSFTPTLFVSTPSVADVWTTNTVRNGGGSGEALQACADAVWTKVTWSADISGYTDIGNGVEFRLRVPSGSLVAGDTVRLAEMNLTPGAVYLPIEPEDYDEVLWKSLVYFQAIVPATSFGWITAGYAISTTSTRCLLNFARPMRTTPTLTFSAGATFNVQDAAGNNITGTGISSSSGTDRVIVLIPTVAAGLTAGQGISLTRDNVDTTFILIDAEL